MKALPVLLLAVAAIAASPSVALACHGRRAAVVYGDGGGYAVAVHHGYYGARYGVYAPAYGGAGLYWGQGRRVARRVARRHDRWD